jgi:hypothetical protein
MQMATFADGQFFDGQSHLTEHGARLRTEIVCSQLKQFEHVAGHPVVNASHTHSLY